MAKSFTDNIAAIGTSTAQQALATNKQVRFTFTGTYTGVTGVIQVSNDGTFYVNLLGIREDTGAGFTGNISAANFSVLANISGWTYYRLNVTALGSGTLVARADEGSYALPQGVQPISLSFASAVVTNSSANALTAGANGTTNPALNVDASAVSAATGWNHVAAAAGSGTALAVISSGTNEFGTVDAKGTGSLKLNSVGGTGAVQIGGAASGANATGLKVTPAAAASGLAIAVVSTGSNEAATLDSKGSGTLSLQTVATGNVLVGQSLLVNGAAKGVGYGTGAGGTVSQSTSRSTGVTLNKATGQITTNTTSLAAGAFADFVVTNSVVVATDVVVANVTPGGTGSPSVSVVNVAAGSFTVRVFNQHASTADTSADVINFAVIKGVTS